MKHSVICVDIKNFMVVLLRNLTPLMGNWSIKIEMVFCMLRKSMRIALCRVGHQLRKIMMIISIIELVMNSCVGYLANDKNKYTIYILNIYLLSININIHRNSKYLSVYLFFP